MLERPPARGGETQFSWFPGCDILSDVGGKHMALRGCLAILKDEGIQIPEWERELREKEKKAEEESGKRKTGYL